MMTPFARLPATLPAHQPSGLSRSRRSTSATPCGPALTIRPAPEDGHAALARGAALRQRLGHYLGATFYFEGEWYWGLDRLPYLETRLASFRNNGAGPIVKTLEASEAADSRSGGVIDFFLSFRSPYTYLAATASTPSPSAMVQRCGCDSRRRW